MKSVAKYASFLAIYVNVPSLIRYGFLLLCSISPGLENENICQPQIFKFSQKHKGEVCITIFSQNFTVIFLVEWLLSGLAVHEAYFSGVFGMLSHGWFCKGSY